VTSGHAPWSSNPERENDITVQRKMHVAIIGAGPIGLDAALAARALGLSYTIFESGTQAGENIRAWSHVQLFSPWSMNVSERMRSAVDEEEGAPLPDGPEYPSGGEFCSKLLEPIAALSGVRDSLRLRSRVIGVSRDGLLKDDEIGTGLRARSRFRILVEEAGRERIEHADFVLDCSGTFHNPNTLGDGGIPAPGERSAERFVERTIPDFESDASWAGKSILLVGGGHSAQTAAEGLAKICALNPETRVLWVLRGATPEFSVLEDDPLPERARLGAAANLIVQGSHEGITVRRGDVVHEVRVEGDDVRVSLRGATGTTSDVVVERILSLTGAVGDHTIYRQLQVHECYATSGPMNLAAALLGGSGADCLAQESHGIDTLKNPEPNFYLLGAKSYGRNSAFLLRIGYAQVTDVFGEIARTLDRDEASPVPIEAGTT